MFNSYMILGECYIRLSLFDDAKNELQKAIELTENGAPYLSLARLYVTEHKINDAIQVYTKAVT